MIRTLTLLLVAKVCAEWVEISQHHYRKPIRTHSSFTTADRAMQVEDTTKPWSYRNHSVTEYNWNKSPGNANIGNVKRVQHVESTLKPTDKIIYENENPDLDEDIIDYELTPNYGSTRPTTELNEPEKQRGIIVKVPNLGNIKRVQLSNSPVKSPVVKYKGDKEKSSNRYKSTTQEYDIQTEVNEFDGIQKTSKNNRRIYVNKYSTEKTATFPPDEDDDSSHIAEQVTTKKILKQAYDNRTAVKIVFSGEPTFTTDTEDYKDTKTQLNRYKKVTNSKSTVIDQLNIFTTESTAIEEEVSTNIQASKVTTEKVTTGHDQKQVDKTVDFETESYENKAHQSSNDDKPLNVTDDLNTNVSIASADQGAHKKQNKDKKGHSAKGTQTEFDKMKTMENVIKFMRVVAETISKNSQRTFGGKMQYLHELKDSILANIEERIDSTWPDDDSAGARRQSRSAHASPRGHVQFPSSESALMTISFLTFAVFLIKLVLQVIQTYKHKAMMVAPLVVASSGRNVFAQRDHENH